MLAFYQEIIARWCLKLGLNLFKFNIQTNQLFLVLIVCSIRTFKIKTETNQFSHLSFK